MISPFPAFKPSNLPSHPPYPPSQAATTTYDPTSSSSQTSPDLEYTVTYGDGSIVNADIYQDDVTLGTNVIKGQTFGVANSYDGSSAMGYG